MQMKAVLQPDIDTMTYPPPIFFNDFWLLREHYIPLNETLTEVQLALDLSQMPMWKFTIFTQVEKSFTMQVSRARYQRVQTFSPLLESAQSLRGEVATFLLHGPIDGDELVALGCVQCHVQSKGCRRRAPPLLFTCTMWMSCAACMTGELSKDCGVMPSIPISKAC
jgi:hypothetical protein